MPIKGFQFVLFLGFASESRQKIFLGVLFRIFFGLLQIFFQKVSQDFFFENTSRVPTEIVYTILPGILQKVSKRFIYEFQQRHCFREFRSGIPPDFFREFLFGIFKGFSNDFFGDSFIKICSETSPRIPSIFLAIIIKTSEKNPGEIPKRFPGVIFDETTEKKLEMNPCESLYMHP